MLNNLLGLKMIRNDVYFTEESEEFIIRCAKRLRNPYSLDEEFIVLTNVLYVERIDEKRQRKRTTGPFVSVALERSTKGFGVAQLPLSGKKVFLNGFDNETEITLKLDKTDPKSTGRIRIERNC